MPHPAEVPKPALTIADLHLIGKLMFDLSADDVLSDAELLRADQLYYVFDAYLSKVVGGLWDTTEALV